MTARFDTIELEQLAPDRVRVSGTTGQPPPPTLKVAMNELGGYRNSFAVALTGLDVDAKAAFAAGALLGRLPVRPRATSHRSRAGSIRTDKTILRRRRRRRRCGG